MAIEVSLIRSVLGIIMGILIIAVPGVLRFLVGGYILITGIIMVPASLL